MLDTNTNRWLKHIAGTLARIILFRQWCAEIQPTGNLQPN